MKISILWARIALSFLFCFSENNVWGQTGKITGKVMDAEGHPIEFVPLSVKRLPDSIQIATQTSDEQGNFVFGQLPKGMYLLKAQQIGYQKLVVSPIPIEDAEKKINLILHALHLVSEEVVIEAKKPLVRQEADKMVVDVENSLASTGLNAQDVLQRSPGVSIDKDGKITIKGKGGVLIMLDELCLKSSFSLNNCRTIFCFRVVFLSSAQCERLFE